MKTRTILAIVHAGDRIPFDGTVIDGLATVDESAETGVSTPALLDACVGRNNAIAGTLVIEGWLKIESPLDGRMRKSNLDSSGGGVPGRTRPSTRAALVVLLVLLVGLLAAAYVGGPSLWH
ncbi:MAG: hypothetical protein JSS86_18335 [Cyanobacteria bacterium SZAS LIN-2]|nr:hypothetical protein [Cyanobacteria bacterium SZAS LIN-2]